MQIHKKCHPKSGDIVKIKEGVEHFQQPNFGGSEFHLEDWHDRLMGKSWMDCDGNPACLIYGMRSATANLPIDNDVVYGKVNGLGHLVHVSELDL